MSDERLRILNLVNLYPPAIGGLERGVAAIAEGLAARGHDVSALTYLVPGAPELEDRNGVRVMRVKDLVSRTPKVSHVDPDHPYHPTFPDPFVVKALRDLLHAETFDLVHTHDWINHSYLPPKDHGPGLHVHTAHEYGLLCPKKTLEYQTKGMAEATFCAGPELRKCLTCAPQRYGTARGTALTLGRQAGRARHRDIDALFAISTAVADVHARIDPAFRDPRPFLVPEFVPDGLDVVARTTPRPDFLPDEPYILFVGAMGRHKGLHVLFEAHRMLTDDDPEHTPKLVCLGTPRDDTPTVPDDVIVVENVAHHQVMAAWHHASAGIVPSVWQEPLGLVAVEAMLAGTPVVASAVGGLVDVVIDEETGLQVPPGDAHALAKAIRRVLDDETLRAELTANGAVHAKRFEATTVIDTIEGLYRTLLADHREPAR